MLPFEASLKNFNSESHSTFEKLARLKQLQRDSTYLSVEINQPVYPANHYNDPYSHLQWYLSTIKHPQATQLLIGADQEEITVAVVDSGVFLGHEDLQGRLVPGYDFVSDINSSCDGDGIDPDANDPGDKQFVDASTYHGTHVAGIIAANIDNQIGVAGVAPTVKIMPLRAVGCGDGNSYDLLQAIRFAAGLPNDSGVVPDVPADIINISLGSPGYSATFQSLINEVSSLGIIVVAAAGNDASNAPVYPAALHNVISVSASNRLNQPAPYTSFGSSVDIAAPGGDFSTDVDNNGVGDAILGLVANEEGSEQFSAYRWYEGTSMAAPVVSGGLALLKSINKNLNINDIEQLLIERQLTHTDTSGFSEYLGYGVLDLEAGLLSQMSDVSPGAQLFSTHHLLHLNPLQRSAQFELKQTDGNPITILSVTPNDPWLSIEALSTSPTGLGSYRVTVEDDTLAYGRHEGSISITASNDQTLTLQVTFTNRQPTSPSIQNETGSAWLLLLDTVTDEVLYQRSAPLKDGQYQFSLRDERTGEYFLVAGTDVDNDLEICNEGELCAGYPSISELSPVNLIEGSDLPVSLHLKPLGGPLSALNTKSLVLLPETSKD
jgi:serine protease